MAASTTGQNEWHIVDCGRVQYTLPIRYQEPVPIGQGAYGSVIRATDTETNTHVAIKKLLNPFQSRVHAKRTYRELKLLTCLNHPDAQVIQLYNVFTPEKNVKDFQTLYFVFNFADYDLNRAIKRRVPFSEDHIRQIVYSLLRGLKFIHSAGVLHRDLKPMNIGIDKNSNVTILDFGLARVASNEDYSPYVATRWWRAPEVYIDEAHYGDKLDIWSVGCMMGELIRLEPLFPGNGHIDQLNKIFEMLGTPDLKTLKEICTPDVYTHISTWEPKPKQDFNDLFGFKYNPVTNDIVSGVSPAGIALLDRLLSFDHRIRPTAEEALADPFFESYHDPMEEPTAEKIFDEHQYEAYTVSEWKDIVWRMVEEFLPPSWVFEDTSDD